MTKDREFKNKRVLILGFGISGQSAALFLLKRGAKVTACDKIVKLPLSQNIQALVNVGVILVTENDIISVTDFDLIVASPGISRDHFLYKKALDNGIKIIGEVELATSEIAFQKTCIAVTGTNGKTTVTMLVEHILKSAGIKAKAFGNIGIPLTSAIDDPDFSELDVIVLELSSFQLETLSTRFIDFGAILNITPDHLDRYSTMQDYAMAKAKLKDNLKQNGKLFVEDTCYWHYESLFNLETAVQDCKIYTYGYSEEFLQNFSQANPLKESKRQKPCNIYSDGQSIFFDGEEKFLLAEDQRFKKNHDVENMMAAFALCKQVGIRCQEFLLGLSSFKKPPHRIEFVRTVAGIDFINDSKGTNIDAVIRAVQTVNGKIVLIAGGVDKGFPYDVWIPIFQKKVKMVLSIGQSKEKIKRDLNGHIPVEMFPTLISAVEYGAKIALAGETVLLSPGCSSYDMFKDYAHRGMEFRRIVNALKEEEVK